MSILFQILLTTVGLSLISLIGGVLLLLHRKLIDDSAPQFVGFAAGVMLTTAFLDLIPESFEHATGDDIYIYGLAGVVIFFLLERFVLWFHHHDETDTKPTAYLILLGDTIHNLFDGLAIAAAFLLNPTIGITAAIAIAAHEIPQEIADFSILVAGGMDKKKALFFNFLSALTALIGAVLGFYFLNTFKEIIPIFLFFTAGVFIYIACSDLIPDLHQHFKKQKKWTSVIPFLLGIVLMYSIITFVGHH